MLHEAMWLMLNQDVPDDYVVAMGKLHSVQQLLELAFSVVDLDYNNYVKTNTDYYRADNEIPLQVDASKAREKLNWQPSKSFEDIVKEMVLSDIELFKKAA